jgi:hypothetical protein
MVEHRARKAPSGKEKTADFAKKFGVPSDREYRKKPQCVPTVTSKRNRWRIFCKNFNDTATAGRPDKILVKVPIVIFGPLLREYTFSGVEPLKLILVTFSWI